MARVFEGISDEADNARLVPLGPFNTIKRDPVEPVPVGTLIAWVFRVTGYDPDCDGSLMVRAEQVDHHGESTGWEVDSVGLHPGDLLLDDADELQRMEGSYQRGRADVLARVRQLPRHREWKIAERFTDWRHGSDGDAEYVKWSDVERVLAEAHASEEPRPGAAARTTPEGE